MWESSVTHDQLAHRGECRFTNLLTPVVRDQLRKDIPGASTDRELMATPNQIAELQTLVRHVRDALDAIAALSEVARTDPNPAIRAVAAEALADAYGELWGTTDRLTMARDNLGMTIATTPGDIREVIQMAIDTYNRVSTENVRAQ